MILVGVYEISRRGREGRETDRQAEDLDMFYNA